MISSDQEDSPADRPLSDRTNIETAGEHDGELLAKKREEGRERTRLCRERKKAAKQKDENPPGEHEDPLLAKRRADQRERTRLCRERKKAAKQNENNLPGGKENQPLDMQPNQGSRKHGVLVTTRYSKIIFEPDRPEAEAMRGFQRRLTNAPNQARQLGRDRLKDMNVL
ncbi:hypothetical protein EJB05_09113, partial [Eragrostis curvula]